MLAKTSAVQPNAEIWLQLGQADFDLLTPEAGPFALNRAASAYQHSIVSATASGSGAKQALLAQARYKLAWTYYKQQRYQAAVRAFVDLMQMNAGADFDTEATTYLAAAVTELDFVGPAADEPFIPRPDVLDTEHDPRVAEAKMAIGLTRIATPALVPQDRPWTPSAYLALAHEYRELNQLDNALQAYGLYLGRWPLDDLALQARLEVGLAWETVARAKKQQAGARKNARRAFADVELNGQPGGPWYVAHQADPKALASAAAIVASARTRLTAPRERVLIAPDVDSRCECEASAGCGCDSAPATPRGVGSADQSARNSAHSRRLAVASLVQWSPSVRRFRRHTGEKDHVRSLASYDPRRCPSCPQRGPGDGLRRRLGASGRSRDEPRGS